MAKAVLMLAAFAEKACQSSLCFYSIHLYNTFAKIVVEKLFDKPDFIDLAHIYKNSRYN